MKKLLLSSLFISGMAIGSNAAIHTINQVGFAFSPVNTIASVGDTVIITLTGIHNATEVSAATWAANGTTPIGGGFAFSAPGDTVFITAATTRYFVCTIHVGSIGMKGTIDASGLSTNDLNKSFSMSLYPNPTNDFINLSVTGSENQIVNIDIINVLGSKVMDCGGKQTLNNGVKRMDVSTLPRGVYFLNIVGDNRTKSIRFVKQ